MQGSLETVESIEALKRELNEARQQQAATADVLKVISRSAFDLQVVFETLINSAVHLCAADFGSIYLREGDLFRQAANSGSTADYRAVEQANPHSIGRGTMVGRAALERVTIHVPDLLLDPEYEFPEATTIGGIRAVVAVPLLRDQEVIGVLGFARRAAGPYSVRQIELVQTFADQAGIAIENVRLIKQLEAKTRDLGEALQQQTATADVLKVISRSAFDLQAVFDTLIASAVELCGANRGAIFLRDGDVFRLRAASGSSREYFAYWQAHPARAGRGSATARVILSGKVESIPDVLEDAEMEMPANTLIKIRATLGVPLLRDSQVEGVLVLTRPQPGDFTTRQVELVQTFADQAVIAIENVRLFEEVQARTRDLSEALQQQTATSEVLKVISRSTFGLKAVFQTLIDSAVRLCAKDGVIYLRHGDVFLAEAAFDANEERLKARSARNAGRDSITGRVALSGSVEQIPDNLADPDFTVPPDQRLKGIRALLGVPLLRDGKVEGVFVLGRAKPGFFTERQIELVRTFADQAVIAIENVRLFEQVQARTDELARSLNELRGAQDRLVQTEKLASLGQLTAGIAHEIKNPLNFVNNFSELSRDLLDELNELVGGTGSGLDKKARDEVTELTGMIKSNLDKVVQHGRRADSIVKNMLLHSREGGGERRSVDLNAVVEESLNLAYHGARAERPGFNITLAKDLDPAVGRIDLYPQEFTRVLLNLISNGFYAAHRKKTDGSPGFEPALGVSTKALPDRIEIRVRDNGTGIPDSVKAKMFNPFFTTKPAGEGTGLGLSLSHDIIVKQLGGTIGVDTKLGEFTEFTIALPRAASPATSSGSRN